MWCNASHLARVANLLKARTYDCHALTLPGHEPGAGQADAVAALSMKSYVDAVVGFIQGQQFQQPPVLIGHSMGGLLAQMAATQTDVAALVLLTPAAPAGIPAITLKMLPLALHIFGRPRFWKRAHTLPPERARRSAVNGLLPQHQERIINSLQAESGKAASEMGLWWADAARTTAVSAAAISCPVYTVSAGQDHLTPESVVRKVAARYANSTLRHWPERSHWVIDDADTEEMVHEIDGWLRPVLKRNTPRKRNS
jgi:pimeloyl-ACP methyl ester carboxylesterase